MLATLIRFVGLRQLRAKPGRTALTVLGVALGVALFVAISAINDSTLQFFRDNVSSITGKATFTVFGSEAGFPEEKVDVVRSVPGVASAVPMIESRVRFEGGAGREAAVRCRKPGRALWTGAIRRSGHEPRRVGPGPGSPRRRPR